MRYLYFRGSLEEFLLLLQRLDVSDKVKDE